jgi:hypothetical protein
MIHVVAMKCLIGLPLLTFQSLAVTLRTTRFNIKTFYVVLTLNSCALYAYENK